MDFLGRLSKFLVPIELYMLRWLIIFVECISWNFNSSQNSLFSFNVIDKRLSIPKKA